jgi:hypothetical protein
MVSVLAIRGSLVHTRPLQRIFKGGKRTACKRTLRVGKNFFVDKIHYFRRPDPLDLLPDGSAGTAAHRLGIPAFDSG